MRLFYCPVQTYKKALILLFHPHCFFNSAILKPTPEMLELARIETEYFFDSGGFQHFTINNNYLNGKGDKRCTMIEGIGTCQIGNVKIIDPIDLCANYGEFGARFAFTMDLPMITSSDQEFKNNLSTSFELAKRMFELRPTLCSKTKFLLPLQFDTKEQLHKYFKKMSTLKPEGWAFPGRVYRKWDKNLKVAYILSFLHSKEANTVHILGTSRPGVIILSAAALNLGLFGQISFDSKTWYTPSTTGRFDSIDNRTLKVTPISSYNKIKIIWPKEYKLPLQQHFQSYKVPWEDKLLFANVLAIDSFTQSMLKLAANIDNLKKYVETQKYLSKQKDGILGGIDILVAAKKKGYKFIEEQFAWIWY